MSRRKVPQGFTFDDHAMDATDPTPSASTGRSQPRSRPRPTNGNHARHDRRDLGDTPRRAAGSRRGTVFSVGWAGGEAAVRVAGQPPAALMDRAMVGPAHQGQVLEVGGAAMEPVDQMVGLAPGRGPVAAGHRAAAVADHQGGPLGGRDDPAGPADLQRLGAATPKGRGSRVAATRSRAARLSPPGWWSLGWR